MMLDSNNVSQMHQHTDDHQKQGRPSMAEVEALLKYHQTSEDTATPHVSSAEAIEQFSPTEISRLYDNACGQTLYENSVSKPVDSIMSSNRLPPATVNTTSRANGVKSQNARATANIVTGAGGNNSALRDFDPMTQKSLPGFGNKMGGHPAQLRVGQSYNPGSKGIAGILGKQSSLFGNGPAKNPSSNLFFLMNAFGVEDKQDQQLLTYNYKEQVFSKHNQLEQLKFPGVESGDPQQYQQDKSVDFALASPPAFSMTEKNQRMKTHVIMSKDGKQKPNLRLTQISTAQGGANPNDIAGGMLLSSKVMMQNNSPVSTATDMLSPEHFRMKKVATGFDTEDSLLLPMVNQNEQDTAEKNANQQ